MIGIGTPPRALALALSFAAAVPVAAVAQSTTVRVDTGRIVRVLPDRAMFGHNFSFANKANQTWDSQRGEFREPFGQRFREMNPGLLRYPGGNWSYGFHFNLARQGIAHWINTGKVRPDFRPQDLLRSLRRLPAASALVHLSPIWSSPEEAAAFAAYLIGSTSDRRRIGIDSWGRVDPASGKKLDWRTVGHWASMRVRDRAPPHRGVLYFQVGNEEWIHWCRKGSCSGRTDYYGRKRPARQMTVENTGLTDRSSGVRVNAYWPAYRAIYLKMREFFPAAQVKMGALLYAGPDGVSGTDKVLRTGKRWNEVLLKRLARDDRVTADFVALHAYMYGKGGWEKDFPRAGSANVLFASDHLAARIRTIFSHAKSRPYPVMVTEFNIHVQRKIPPSSLLSALYYVDWVMAGLGNPNIIGMMRWQTANWRQHRGFSGAALFATDGGRKRNSGRLWKMGPYYAAKLLGGLDRRIAAVTVTDVPTFRPRGLKGKSTLSGRATPWWKPSPQPLLTATATLSDDGRDLGVLILNKGTKRDIKLRLVLDKFTPEPRYVASTLNVTRPSGHNDIFRINPWRKTKRSKCVPARGGCTRNLASEAGENVVLTSRTVSGAGATMSVTVPAHAAILLKLKRRR